MDNMYQPPAGGPEDNWPTQEFEPSGGQQPPAAPQRQQQPRYRRKLRWGAGLALAAVLAGGGALAATELAGGPGASAAQDTGQAAALNTILSSASTPVSGAGTGSAGGSAASADSAALSGQKTPGSGAQAQGRHPAAAACKQAISSLRSAQRPRVARAVRRACRRGAVRRLAALRGLHGQFTVKSKSGVVTIGFARGVVQSADSGSVVIKAADNTIWTWHLASTTVIREGGKKVSASSLAAGQQVFAGGQLVSGAGNARLVVIRPAHGQGSSSAPSSGGSPSGTSSGS
jgi:hypothetical protein